MLHAGNNSSPSQLKVVIERYGLDEAAAMLPQLQALFDGAYYDSHMYRDLADDLSHAPDPFRLFLARLGTSGEVIGAIVVEAKVHAAFDYLSFPPVHFKRFTVAAAARGHGVGKQLLDAAKHYCFEELELQVAFGESNEIGALSLYGREGALYSKEPIWEYWRRNTPEQGLKYFAMDINDSKRRGERYPDGDGIRFVFARDEKTAQYFRTQGYISREELLA